MNYIFKEGILLKKINVFKKRNEENNTKNLPSINKAIKKLSVGVLSCALSCTMILSPVAAGARKYSCNYKYRRECFFWKCKYNKSETKAC